MTENTLCTCVLKASLTARCFHCAYISQGVSKRFSKGLDEANTARSSLRPTEKSLATQRSNSVQIKLDDDLQSLVSALHACITCMSHFCVIPLNARFALQQASFNHFSIFMCNIMAECWCVMRRFSGPDLFTCTACGDQATARLCLFMAGYNFEQAGWTRSRKRSCESAACNSSAAG